MKKFLTTILMVVILLGGILGPFGVNAAPGDPIGRNRLPTDSGAFGGSTIDLQSTQAGQQTTAEKASGGKVASKAEQLQCGFTNLKACLAILGDSTMSLSARALWMTGYFFDTALDYSLNLSRTLSQLKVVDRAWAAGRDVANIIFIFILLYIAIATILQVEGFNTKKLLTNVIMIALLVNFSLVITKVVIDTSNILAAGFYNQMTNNGANTISEQYMEGLRLESIYKAGEANNDTLKVSSGGDSTYGQILTITVFGSIFILVAAFVFFAGAVLFLIRTIVLVFLMILSPLAFLASILPGTSEHAKKWWNMLFDQSFFAPVFLFLNYAVILVIRGGGVSTQGLTSETATGTSGPFSAALIGSGATSLSVIFNFALLTGMIIASLVVAKSMGAYGADTMMKWGDNTRKFGQGFVGRHTIGRAAAVIGESETARRMLGAIPGGRYVAQGLNAVAAAPFGGTKGGYTGAVKQTAERQAKYADYLGRGAGGKERQAAYIKSLEGGTFAKGLRTYTGIGSAGSQAVKMIEKNAAKQAAKKSKEDELAKLKDEKIALEKMPKEKDETRLKELKLARTLTAQPGELANISDEMAEIAKRRERTIAVLNRIRDLEDKLEMTEKIDKLSADVGKKGEVVSSDKSKSGK